MFNLTDCNSSQREAVTFGEGPLLLLAGPGSGKTFTITKRILWLIHEKKVAPEQILVITFTREAALSMQQRFAQTSSFAGSVNFGTFHSIFYQILLRSWMRSRITKIPEKRKKHWKKSRRNGKIAFLRYIGNMSLPGRKFKVLILMIC